MNSSQELERSVLLVLGDMACDLQYVFFIVTTRCHPFECSNIHVQVHIYHHIYIYIYIYIYISSVPWSSTSEEEDTESWLMGSFAKFSACLGLPTKGFEEEIWHLLSIMNDRNTKKEGVMV